MERLHTLHDIFILEWRGYKEKLKDCIKESEENAKHRVEDIEVITALLEKLRDLVEEMEMDEMDVVMEELESYDYPVEVQQGMERLGVYVLNLDGEQAIAQIGELLELFKDFDT